MTMTTRLALAIALLLAAGAPARAAETDELEVDKAWTGGFVVVGFLGYTLTEVVFKEDLAPESCKWCDGDELNFVDEGVRDALVWENTRPARLISDGGLVLTPVVMGGMLAYAAHRDGSLGNWDEDGLIVLEGVVLATSINQLVKLLVGRERPFVRALPPGEKGLTDKPEDNNLSFYSGHASFTFSLAVGAGTVASLRGYAWAPWIWGTGLAMAGTTGYLRIAGDKHYFSDVMLGAVVGSAIGFAVPYYFHRKKDGGAGESTALSGEPLPGGGLVMVSGVF